MIIKRIIITLLATFSIWSCFAHATDNRIFERFYNLSPEEFENQIKDYYKHDFIDSTMLCANIQASKYGKNNLTV
jgi:hypothetical protein